MRKILSLFILGVLFLSNMGGALANNRIDLVELFKQQKDIVISGVKLTSIMKIRLNSKQKISDVYNDIYWNGYHANQIVCRTAWMADQNNTKIVPKIMWSAWYQPGAMVSLSTECVDTEKKPGATTSWWRQGYRWIGSGFEPHMELLWLDHWSAIQSGHNPNIAPKYRWCKAGSFSFGEIQNGDISWHQKYSRAVFEYIPALDSYGLASRDITCTDDIKTYSKWVSTPGWRFIFVKSLK